MTPILSNTSGVQHKDTFINDGVTCDVEEL